ncbi:MAG TPA: flotillin-like FloA family protein [Phycisphaerales bacterium]|nr:flotillin-like FloA family protein [Phycisphaerales bacterium]
MLYAVALALLAVFIVAAILHLTPMVNLFVQARFSGAAIEFVDLIGMRLRKVDPKVIVLNLIRSQKAGLGLTVRQLEMHHLAGGRVDGVVSAMIVAQTAGVPLSWEAATSLDLAGRNVLDLARESIEPFWLDCTPEGAVRVSTLDGTKLSITVRAKARPDLEAAVGGAAETCLTDRIAEVAAQEAARCTDGRLLAADPDRLNGLLAARRLDRGTALKVLSYDSSVAMER